MKNEKPNALVDGSANGLVEHFLLLLAANDEKFHWRPIVALATHRLFACCLYIFDAFFSRKYAGGGESSAVGHMLAF